MLTLKYELQIVSRNELDKCNKCIKVRCSLHWDQMGKKYKSHT